MSQPEMQLPGGVEPATGYFEEIDWRDGTLSVVGWMLAPEKSLDRIVLSLDGRPAASATPTSRPDVASDYPWIAKAGESGFRFRAGWSSAEGRIDLVGEGGGRPVCRMSALFVCGPAAERRIAPARMTERSTGAAGRLHRLQGLRIFTDFYDQILRFRGGGGPFELLDWGCGSGRLTAHMVHFLNARVTGADIDSEAIQWCRRNLPEARFDVIGSQPPLPYPDRRFDLVIACSVFTHLRKDDQEGWIRELARVLRPEGILLASTHGEFAHRKRLYGTGGLRRLLRLAGARPRKLKGIVDGERDRAFDGIAPHGYYRNVYQSREHTLAHWTQGFRCLDYIERGVDGFQDLVVLRAGG